MKPTELVFSDIVSVVPSGQKIRIAAIHKDKVGYYSVLHRLEWVRMSLIRPILVTPEILERTGFLLNNHIYPYPCYEYENKENKLKVVFAFPHGNKTSYKDPWVFIDSENIYIEHLPCVFVHQLQQILRLCQIEKEIVI